MLALWMPQSKNRPQQGYKQRILHDKEKNFYCKIHNIPSGFHVVDTNHDNLKLKIEQGCTFLAYGIDYFFLRDAAINGMNKLKEGLK